MAAAVVDHQKGIDVASSGSSITMTIPAKGSSGCDEAGVPGSRDATGVPVGVHMRLRNTIQTNPTVTASDAAAGIAATFT